MHYQLKISRHRFCSMRSRLVDPFFRRLRRLRWQLWMQLERCFAFSHTSNTRTFVDHSLVDVGYEKTLKVYSIDWRVKWSRRVVFSR
jgi:hypothetical protein